MIWPIKSKGINFVKYIVNRFLEANLVGSSAEVTIISFIICKLISISIKSYFLPHRIMLLRERSEKKIFIDSH